MILEFLESEVWLYYIWWKDIKVNLLLLALVKRLVSVLVILGPLTDGHDEYRCADDAKGLSIISRYIFIARKRWHYNTLEAYFQRRVFLFISFRLRIQLLKRLRNRGEYILMSGHEMDTFVDPSVDLEGIENLAWEKQPKRVYITCHSMRSPWVTKPATHKKI